MVDQTKPTSEQNSSTLKQKYPRRYPTMTLIQQVHTSRLSGSLTVPALSRQLYQPGMKNCHLSRTPSKTLEARYKTIRSNSTYDLLGTNSTHRGYFPRFSPACWTHHCNSPTLYNLVKQPNTKPPLRFVVGCRKSSLAVTSLFPYPGIVHRLR